LRPAHYITIAAAILLVVILYRWGNTVPPKSANAPQQTANSTPTGPATMEPASFDSILSAAKTQLPSEATGEVKNLEQELEATHDSSRMASVFIKIAQIYEANKQMPVAGYYSALAAKLENSEKMLTFAGQFFLDRLSETDSPAVQQWELLQANDCFQRAVNLSQDSDTPKIGLATTYVAMGETMKGVGLLRELTEKEPDNIPANMLLGQLSIQSGQLDKAIDRFSKVLKKDPNNANAMLYLAEVYERENDKAKAIEWFEKAKNTTSNQDLKKDIEKHLANIK
jgi:tetratricopeptide (TPR) repeat protein